MPDDQAPFKPQRQYWLIPLEFAWFDFTVAHRERLCIYAGIAPGFGRAEWRELSADDQRKIHTAFLVEWGVLTNKAKGAG